MAVNPSPKVAVARNYAKKFNKNMVVILAIKGNELEYASYGVNKGLCREAKDLADVAYDALMKRGWA
jgi:hypothetical protein